MWCYTRRNHISSFGERTSPFNSAGISVYSTTGKRVVRISGSNAGCTMFRGSVKGIGYPLPSLPSRASPCAITFQLESNTFQLIICLAEPGKGFVTLIFVVQGGGRRGLCDIQWHLADLSVCQFWRLLTRRILSASATQTTSLEERSLRK